MTRKTEPKMASRSQNNNPSKTQPVCCAETSSSTYQASIIPDIPKAGNKIIAPNLKKKITFRKIEFKLVRERSPEPYPQCIQSPMDVIKVLQTIKDSPQEHFVVLYLNGANGISAINFVTTGLLNSSQTHPREIFRGAVMLDCASVILAHNHPSGSLSPSEADIQITNQLVEGGKILGITVLDHIIISQEGHKSMKESGYM